MSLNKKSNEYHSIASIKNNLLKLKYDSYLTGIKAEEKKSKNFGSNYKVHLNLNKRLNRLNSYQKFKNEIENDYKFDAFIQSEIDLDSSFRSISSSTTTSNSLPKSTSLSRLPPLKHQHSSQSNYNYEDKRFSIVLSPQKNEYNVFKVFPNMKLAEKNSHQKVKNYLNYKSESELDRLTQSQMFENRTDLESRMTKLKNYVSTEFEESDYFTFSNNKM